jgi:hypothetical protein
VWNSPAARWIAVREDQWLVALGISHVSHAAAICANRLVAATPEPMPWFVLAGGGLGYLMIAALVLTSFEGPASALGRRTAALRNVAWPFLWVFFAGVYTQRVIVESVAFLPLALALYGALAVRVLGRARARSTMVSPHAT